MSVLFVSGYWGSVERCPSRDACWTWLRKSTRSPTVNCWRRSSYRRPTTCASTVGVPTTVTRVTPSAAIQTRWRDRSRRSCRPRSWPIARSGGTRGAGPTTKGGRHNGNKVHLLYMISGFSPKRTVTVWTKELNFQVIISWDIQMFSFHGLLLLWGSSFYPFNWDVHASCLVSIDVFC